MNKTIVPLIFGIVGCAVLLSLGIWQMKRLAWKEAMLAQITAQIGAEPVTLAEAPFPEFTSVKASGTITQPEIHVLTSIKGQGAGYRVISVLETEGRRILLDRGFIEQSDKNLARSEVVATITGNFRTVQEKDNFTPEPDLGANIWFARDVPALAKALNAEPLLLILRETSESNPPVTPQPVTTTGIPNDHLGYAATWFMLAAAWAGMTGYFLWRNRQRTT